VPRHRADARADQRARRAEHLRRDLIFAVRDKIALDAYQIIGAIRGEAKARVPVMVTMGNIWPPRTCADRAAAVKNEMSNVLLFSWNFLLPFCAFLDTTKNIFTSPMVLRCAELVAS